LDIRFGLGLLGVLVVAVVVGLVAAQSQSKSVAAPAPTVLPTPVSTPQPNHVDIVADPSSGTGGLFVPTTLTVQVGHAVTFVNDDTSSHGVLADNGAFNSGVLTPGETFTWTPKKTGRYEFSDFLVPNMHGALEVVSFAVSG
jgi:plastocyanin